MSSTLTWFTIIIMIGHLYLIRNTINDKVYVGKTYLSLEERFERHKQDSKKNSDRPLYRAIRKYGIDKFYIELIGSFEENDLEDFEILAIQEFNSYNEGYNATLGGDGRRYLTISDTVIIETYLQIQNADAVAKQLRISEDSVFKVLKAYNIPNLYKRPGNSVKFNNIEFATLSDCARYLIDQGLTDNYNIPSVVTSIGRVLNGSRKAYKGLKFSS